MPERKYQIPFERVGLMLRGKYQVPFKKGRPVLAENIGYSLEGVGLY
jgi:hypothetical protein